MKKFIKKILYFGILVVLVLIILGYLLEIQFSKDRSNKFVWLGEIENNQFDYAFLGSSRILNMIDINLIDSSYALKGINLGIGGADSRVLFMLLYTFLEIQNNKLNKLYIQVDPFMLYKDSTYNKPNYDHYFFSNSSNNIIYNCIENKDNLWLYQKFPIIKYIEFNKVYNLTHFIRGFSYSTKWDITKGSNLIYNHFPFTPRKQKTIKKFENNKDDLHFLYEILKLCIKSNIELVLYTAPIFDYDKSYKPVYPNFDSEMQNINDSLNLPYFNFANNFQDEQNYFKDMTHLNYKGTIALTKQIMNKTQLTKNTQN